MSSALDEIKQSVVDDDGIFVIDHITREITYLRNGEIAYYDELPVLVKGDHNSERLTFKIKSEIEGHDMTKCNMIMINYIVVDPSTSEEYKDVYTVSDKDIETITDDDTGIKYIKFSWLIDQNVTRNVGRISFAIQFIAAETETYTETEVDESTGKETEVEKLRQIVNYSWATLPYLELQVTDGIVNTKQEADDTFTDGFSSIVISWYQQILNAIEYVKASRIKSVEQTVTSEEDGGINELTVTYGKNDVEKFQVRNGSKGSSAFEIAKDNGYDGTLEQWVAEFGSEHYNQKLRGETITQEEYDKLSDEDKSRENFIYIIEGETTHADTAAGYTEGGGIDEALKGKAPFVHEHEQYASKDQVTEFTNKVTALVDGRVSNFDIVSIPYNVGSGSYAYFLDTPQTITAPDGYKFTDTKVTSILAEHPTSSESITAVISEDGKTITFDMIGDTETTGTENKNIIETVTTPYTAGIFKHPDGTESITVDVDDIVISAPDGYIIAGVTSTTAIVDPIIAYIEGTGDDSITHTFTITNRNHFDVECTWSAGEYGEGSTQTIPAYSNIECDASSNSSDIDITVQFTYGELVSNTVSGTYPKTDGDHNCCTCKYCGQPISCEHCTDCECCNGVSNGSGSDDEITVDAPGLTSATATVTISDDRKTATISITGTAATTGSGEATVTYNLMLVGDYTASVGYTYELELIADVLDRLTDLENAVDHMTADPEVTENGSAIITYTVSPMQETMSDGNVGYRIYASTETIAAPEKYKFSNVEVTSCSSEDVTPNAAIHNDGAEIRIGLSDEYVLSYSSSTFTVQIDYVYTREIQGGNIYRAKTADNLALTKCTTYTLTADADTLVEATPGRAYLASVILNKGTSVAYTATIYINPETREDEVERVDPETLETITETIIYAVSSRSTLLDTDGHFVSVSRVYRDEKWYAYASVVNTSGDQLPGNITLIEL